MIPEHELRLINPDKKYSFSMFKWNAPSPYNDDIIHRHSYSELLFIQSGSGSHIIGHKRYEARATQVHLVNAGIAHDFQRNYGCTGFTIAFDDAVIQGSSTRMCMEQRGFFDPIFTIDDKEDFSSMVSLSHHIDTSKNYKHSYFIINAIFEILIKGSRTAEKYNHAAHWFSLFIDFMKKNWKSKPRAANLAQKLNLSKEQLNTRVNDSFGISTEELISRYLLSYIKKELLLSHQSISRLALEFGFYDTSHFIRFFKNHEGISPGKFRASILNEM